MGYDMQVDVSQSRTKNNLQQQHTKLDFCRLPKHHRVTPPLSVERGTLIHPIISWQVVQVAQMEQEVALGLAIAEELVALRVLGEGQQMWL